MSKAQRSHQPRQPNRVACQRRPRRARARAADTPAVLALDVESCNAQRRSSGRRLTAADIRRARDVAGRCATAKHLGRYSALGEVSCQRLHRRVGRRLNATEEGIYAAVRRAVRAGHAGLHVTVADLVFKVGRCERSVQSALESLGAHRAPCGGKRCRGVEGGDLCDGCARPCPADCRRHVDLVRTVPQFDELGWVSFDWGPKGPTNKREHVLRQLPNAYVLGRAARRPARPTPMQGRVAVNNAAARSGRHCTPKAFSSSLRSSEKQHPSGSTDDAGCGQPPPGEGREGVPPTGGRDGHVDGHGTVTMRRHASALAERADGKPLERIWLELTGSTRNPFGGLVPIDELPEAPRCAGDPATDPTPESRAPGAGDSAAGGAS